MSLSNYFSDKYLMTSDSIPTEGSFEVGDIVVNTGNNIANEPFWICVEAGSPGTWRTISMNSSVKMVSFKNTVIVDEAVTSVNLGLEFNSDVDTLIVFINDAYAYENIDYVIDNNRRITTLNNKVWNEGLIDDFVFEFIVFKAILDIDDSLSLLPTQIKDNSITINKLSNDIQDVLNASLGDLSAFQKRNDVNLSTTDKTIVGAINELFQNANNGKELIASAIGEPLSAEDTFQAMSTKINNEKQLLASSIGSPISASDTFGTMSTEIETVKNNLKQVLLDEGIEVSNVNNISNLVIELDNEFLDRNNELITLLNSRGAKIAANSSFDDILEYIANMPRIGGAQIEIVSTLPTTVPEQGMVVISNTYTDNVMFYNNVIPVVGTNISEGDIAIVYMDKDDGLNASYEIIKGVSVYLTYCYQVIDGQLVERDFYYSQNGVWNKLNHIICIMNSSKGVYANNTDYPLIMGGHTGTLPEDYSDSDDGDDYTTIADGVLTTTFRNADNNIAGTIDPLSYKDDWWYYYDYGDDYDYDSGTTYFEAESYMYIYTANPIDITGINKLKIDLTADIGEGGKGSSACYVGLMKPDVSTPTSSSTALTVNTSGTGELTLDVSGYDGEYRILIFFRTNYRSSSSSATATANPRNIIVRSIEITR